MPALSQVIDGDIYHCYRPEYKFDRFRFTSLQEGYSRTPIELFGHTQANVLHAPDGTVWVSQFPTPASMISEILNRPNWFLLHAAEQLRRLADCFSALEQLAALFHRSRALFVLKALPAWKDYYTLLAPRTLLVSYCVEAIADTFHTLLLTLADANSVLSFLSDLCRNPVSALLASKQTLPSLRRFLSFPAPITPVFFSPSIDPNCVVASNFDAGFLNLALATPLDQRAAVAHTFCTYRLVVPPLVHTNDYNHLALRGLTAFVNIALEHIALDLVQAGQLAAAPDLLDLDYDEILALAGTYAAARST